VPPKPGTLHPTLRLSTESCTLPASCSAPSTEFRGTLRDRDHTAPEKCGVTLFPIQKKRTTLSSDDYNPRHGVPIDPLLSKTMNKPLPREVLQTLLPILNTRKPLVQEDGLVTLSVISHGHTEILGHLLQDLAHCKPPQLAKLVITLNLCEERPKLPRGLDIPVHWCSNPDPKGFGANHNAAFRYCDTEWFAVVNPDIRFEQDPFEPMIREAGDAFGLIAPTVLNADGSVADSARGLITPWEIIARRIKPSVPFPRPVWMAGMFLLFRADAYRGVSGFDERFHLYCEDFDICARIRLLGWPIKRCEHALVVHDARRASHDSPQHLFWHVCSLLSMWTSRTWWRYKSLLGKESPDQLPRIEPALHEGSQRGSAAAWRRIVSQRVVHKAAEAAPEADPLGVSAARLGDRL